MADNDKHRSLIEAFLAGEIGLDGLTQSLPGALATSPDAPLDYRAFLDDLRMSGRLPHQLYLVLSTIQPGGRVSDTRSPVLLTKPAPTPAAETTETRRRRREDEESGASLSSLLQDARPARTIAPRYETTETRNAPDLGASIGSPAPSGAADGDAAARGRPAIGTSAPLPRLGADATAPRPARRSIFGTSSNGAPIPAEGESERVAQQAPSFGQPRPAEDGRGGGSDGSVGDAPGFGGRAERRRVTGQFGFKDASERRAASEPGVAGTAGDDLLHAGGAFPPGATPVAAAGMASAGTAGAGAAALDDADRDARHNTRVLPDDYDPMEGLVITQPEAGRTSPAEAALHAAEPLPGSLLPEAEIDVNTSAPPAATPVRPRMLGGMPMPGPAAPEAPPPEEDDTQAHVDEAIFARYLSTYRSLKDQRDRAQSNDNQKLDALLQPWQTIRFRRDAAKLADGDADAVSDFGLEEQEGPAEIGPGDIVNKRFVIERVLGEGGMGTVFKAVDRRQLEAKSPNPFVALKLLSHDFRRHPEAYRALERETRKSQILAHPNIITVFDFDRDGRVAYMTMELLDGSSLSGLMHRKGSSLDWKDAEPIIRGVGAALAYAHEQGIVHADIKPGNIFLTTDGRVKLLDFGIAQAIREGVAAAGAAAGNGLEGALTPGFASVEMLEGMPAAPKDDIYAFACVIYEMLSGHHPFDGKTASEAEANGDKPAPIPGLTRKQNAALAEGLAFRREDRPPTMQAFIEGLIELKRGWFGR